MKKVLLFLLLISLLSSCSTKEKDIQEQIIEHYKYNGIQLYQNNESFIQTQFLRSINDVNAFLTEFNSIQKTPSDKTFELKDWDYIIELGEEITPVNNATEPYFKHDTSKFIILIQDNFIQMGSSLYSSKEDIVDIMNNLYSEYVSINKLYGYEPIDWKKY